MVLEPSGGQVLARPDVSGCGRKGISGSWKFS